MLVIQPSTALLRIVSQGRFALQASCQNHPLDVLCRRRRFKSGCEVNFARMLCGSLKSNGLADPFKNNEEDTFPEEQLPPPLQEHDMLPSSDHSLKKARQHADASAAAAAASGQHVAHAYNAQPAQLQQQGLQSQHNGMLQMQFPSFFDLYPAHAHAASQAFAAHSTAPCAVPGGVHPHQNGGGASVNGYADAGSAAFRGMPDQQMTDAQMLRPLTDMSGAADPAGVSPAPAASAAVPMDTTADHGVSQAAEPSSTAQTAAAAPQPEMSMSSAQQAGSSAFVVPPYMSSTVGTTGIMHRPVQYPHFTSGVPSLFHTSLPPAVAPQPDPTAAAAGPTQAFGTMTGLPSISFPGSFGFPPASCAADMFPPNLYYGAAAEAARLHAHNMAPFAKAASASLYGPASLSTFLPTPLAASTLQTPQPEATTAVPAGGGPSQVAGAAAESAGQAGRKRKTPGSSQKKMGKAAAGEPGGPVIARRAANRPPPHVRSLNTLSQAACA